METERYRILEASEAAIFHAKNRVLYDLAISAKGLVIVRQISQTGAIFFKKGFSILQISISPITWNPAWGNQKYFEETNY